MKKYLFGLIVVCSFISQANAGVIYEYSVTGTVDGSTLTTVGVDDSISATFRFELDDLSPSIPVPSAIQVFTGLLQSSTLSVGGVVVEFLGIQSIIADNSTISGPFGRFPLGDSLVHSLSSPTSIQQIDGFDIEAFQLGLSGNSSVLSDFDLDTALNADYSARSSLFAVYFSSSAAINGTIQNISFQQVFDENVASVPEPASLFFILTGLIGLAFKRRKLSLS